MVAIRLCWSLELTQSLEFNSHKVLATWLPIHRGLPPYGCLTMWLLRDVQSQATQKLTGHPDLRMTSAKALQIRHSIPGIRENGGLQAACQPSPSVECPPFFMHVSRACCRRLTWFVAHIIDGAQILLFRPSSLCNRLGQSANSNWMLQS